ncbi:unnamed protein product [Toxocara canis]|uniref:REST corepressor 2 n=1 Tax=Toxocara canis TaxID=6265 RepID=A0A183UHM1_TOXCA|nr:unnamed protein product [Toxocara canis]
MFMDGNEGDVSSASCQDEDEEKEAEEDRSGLTSRATNAHAASAHFAPFRLPTNLEIREGKDYQCAVEDLEEREPQSEFETRDREYCLWLPTDQLADEDVTDFLSVALGVYGIEQDRALYILYTCQYNLDEAYSEIKKRRLVKENWSQEDISLFIRAFKACGKRFLKIKKALPNKSMTQIVNFYYDMKKKLRLRVILDQRIEEGMEDEPSEASESEDTSDEGSSAGPCENCGQVDSNLRQAGDKNVCTTCYSYCNNMLVTCRWKMVDIAESFVDFYTEYFIGTEEHKGAKSAQSLEEDDDVVIVVDQTSVVEPELFPKGNGAWNVSYELYLMLIAISTVASFREKEKQALRERSRCVRMQHEDSLEFKHHLAGGFRHYGKDFEAIASSIETKNVDMIKQFYEQHKDRTDQLVKKFEDAIERNVTKTDFERIFEVVAPQAELVELD